MTPEGRRLAAIALAAAAGLTAVCLVYYPALMSPDSLGMYQQALTGLLDGSRKQPLTAFFWMWILKVAPHPFALLLFQNLVFWSGLALTVAACRLGVTGSVLAVLGAGLWPTVFAHLGTLWSDVLLGAFLTLFVGLALWGARKRSRLLLAVALIPMWCGLAMRSNGFPAIVPLTGWVVALWYTATRTARVPRLTFFAAWALLFIGLVAGWRIFSRAIVSHGSGAPTRSLQFALFHDLAGIAVASNDLRLPAYVHRSLPGFDMDTIRAVYDPADVNLFVYNPRWKIEMFITTKPDEFRELVAVWKGAIAAHPGAYLRRRADAVATMFQVRGVHYPFHMGIDPNTQGLEFQRSPLYDRVTGWLTATKGIFFRGWVFVLASIGMVLLAWRRRRWSTVAVCGSGLCYVAPYLVFTTGSDFRYIWWMVVATLLGALLLLFEGDEARGEQQRPAVAA
jgi:hypothetical protein